MVVVVIVVVVGLALCFFQQLLDLRNTEKKVPKAGILCGNENGFFLFRLAEKGGIRIVRLCKTCKIVVA